MEIIRFDTNVPVEVAFTYAQGIAKDGNFGTQWYRQTTDGRAVYLPEFVENKLIAMDVQPGEIVRLTKAEVRRGQRRSIEWQVVRVDPPGDPADTVQQQPARPPVPQHPAPIQARPVAQPAASRPASGASPAREIAPPPATIQPKPNGTATTHNTTPAAPAKPVYQQSMTNTLRSCLCVAIDAAKDAHEYAAQQGFPLTFGPDQVEAMAISIFIQLSKTTNIQQMNQRYQAGAEARAANGGTSWPH